MKRIVTTLKQYQADQLQQIAKKKKKSVMVLVRAAVLKFLLSQGMTESDNDYDEVTDLIEAAGTKADGRKVSDVIVVRQDPYRHRRARIYMKQFTEKGHIYNEDPVDIFDVCLKVLLPSSVIRKIKAYGMARGYKGNKLTAILCIMIEELSAPDMIGYEINEEFEQMMQEASKQEAFNRGTK